jgi:squalene-associated FAD-dependent desaturase
LAHLGRKLRNEPLAAPVAVVGGGYAGLAAAVELAAAGFSVTLFESARQLGGRARRVEHRGLALDNGQHILIGAYRETLRLMRRVGVDPDRALLRLPLTLDYPGRLRLAAPRLPAPLHLGVALAAARGLPAREKLAAFQFMNCLKAARYTLGRDLTVAALLDDHGQDGAVRELVWEPLCLAALNTPAERASARVFLAVLRDSLGAARRDSDLLLPRCDLSALFPDAAAGFLAARGARILTGTPIRGIAADANGFVLDAGSARHACSKVIVAAPPRRAAALCAGLPRLAPQQAQLDALAYEPIVTCYLRYREEVRLPRPMVGVARGIAQWLFDRGALGGPAGLVSAVASARGRHLELAADALAQRVHAEVAALLPGLDPPEWHCVISERRATFACVPDLARPGNETPLPGLFLAGDYTVEDYPATIESAVRSGLRCAALVIASG